MKNLLMILALAMALTAVPALAADTDTSADTQITADDTQAPAPADTEESGGADQETTKTEG